MLDTLLENQEQTYPSLSGKARLNTASQLELRTCLTYRLQLQRAARLNSFVVLSYLRLPNRSPESPRKSPPGPTSLSRGSNVDTQSYPGLVITALAASELPCLAGNVQILSRAVRLGRPSGWN